MLVLVVLVRGGVNKGFVEEAGNLRQRPVVTVRQAEGSKCYKGSASLFGSVVVCGGRYSETIHSSQLQFEAGWRMPGPALI